MTLKFRYKGRSFSSAKSMMSTMQRDIQSEIERKIRNVASASGTHAVKTAKGLEVKGSVDQMDRFYRRLGK